MVRGLTKRGSGASYLLWCHIYYIGVECGWYWIVALSLGLDLEDGIVSSALSLNKKWHVRARYVYEMYDTESVDESVRARCTVWFSSLR